MIAADMRDLRPFCSRVLLSVVLALTLGCRRSNDSTPADHPRLTAEVTLRNITFRSAALGRDMQYRLMFPLETSGRKLPTVYLLHGGGGGFRDWSNYSDVASFAERGVIFVMPEGDDSYYMNAVERPMDRYEDYIVKDLIADVESRFPAATGRAHRALVGESMGGFAAVRLGLSHPELFVFAAGISPALDVPSRPFSVKRIQPCRYHKSIF